LAHVAELAGGPFLRPQRTVGSIPLPAGEQTAHDRGHDHQGQQPHETGSKGGAEHGHIVRAPAGTEPGTGARSPPTPRGDRRGLGPGPPSQKIAQITRALPHGPRSPGQSRLRARERLYAGGVSPSVYVASPEGMTGKSMVAFGLLEALASRSDRVGVFRPVVQTGRSRDYAVDLLTSHPAVDQAYEDAIGVDHQLVLSDPDTAHERILARHRELDERYSVLVFLGSDYNDLANPTELAFNAEVAANMGAPVVIVLSGLDRSPVQAAALAAVSVGEFGGNHALPLAVVVNRAEPGSLDAIRAAVGQKVPGALVAA